MNRDNDKDMTCTRCNDLGRVPKLKEHDDIDVYLRPFLAVHYSDDDIDVYLRTFLEVRYSVLEKECLIIIWIIAMDKLRYNLYGRKGVII